jgi:cyclophilin family peptidyl-prolyl cis-trans isomerase
MTYRPNHAFRCLGLILVLVAIGCNRSGDGKTSPTAAIAGGNSEAAAKGDSQAALSEKNAADLQHPVVLVETSLGNITLKLDREKAPITVDNFLSYVTSSHYDQTIVHQVYKGQGFLAGGYGVNLMEKPGRTPIRNEATNGLKNRRGTIAMVRSPDVIDSATCQFIVNVTDNPVLDHKDRKLASDFGYCVFGEVTEGMDIVDRIVASPVHDTTELECTPVQPIIIKSARQIR